MRRQKLAKVTMEQMRNTLSDIAWDCASGWIGEDGVDSWSEDRVKNTSKNIINSLTKGEEHEEE